MGVVPGTSVVHLAVLAEHRPSPAMRFVAVAGAWSWLLIFGAVAMGGRAGHSMHLVGLVTGAVVFALAARLVEEPGGVAHDGIVASLGWARSALLLGVAWSLWHLPLSFLDGTYQHELGVGSAELWTSMAVRVPLAVLLVWLVMSTNGLLAAAVVAYALGNAVGNVLPQSSSLLFTELAATGATPGRPVDRPAPRLVAPPCRPRQR